MIRTMKAHAEPSSPRPFDLWVRLYAVALNVEVNVLTAKMNKQHITHFNMRMRNLKDSYDWGTEEVKALVVYCFTHNPLNIDVTQYGTIDNICHASRHFADWYRTHKVDPNLLLRTVIDDSNSSLQAQKLEQVYRV